MDSKPGILVVGSALAVIKPGLVGASTGSGWAVVWTAFGVSLVRFLASVLRPRDEGSVERPSYCLRMDPDQAEELQRAVSDNMREGRRSPAIHLLQQYTGLGFKDAKFLAENVEDWDAMVKIEEPTQSKKGSAVASDDEARPDGFLGLSAEEGSALAREARRLAEKGRKIQAIKLVRKRTQMSLREAKAWVDAREEAGWVGVGLRGDLDSGVSREDARPADTFGLTAEQWRALVREARRLTEKRRKLQAIKLVRKRTEMSLREAKAWVDAGEQDGWVGPAFTAALDSGVLTDGGRAIPSNIRQAVLDRDDYICRYCGRRSQTMEVDHVIPVSQGGISTLENLVTSCRDCNRKKGGRTPEEAGMTVLPVRTRRRDWK